MAAYRIGDIVVRKDEKDIEAMTEKKRLEVVAVNFKDFIMTEDGMYSYYRYTVADANTGEILPDDYDEKELRRV